MLRAEMLCQDHPSDSADYRLRKSAQAQLTKISVGYSAISGDALPAWLAKDAGIFEKNGLDVQPVFFAGGTTAIMALVSADTPIAQLAGPAVVNSVMAGSDATIVAGGVTRSITIYKAGPKSKLPNSSKAARSRSAASARLRISSPATR